MSRVWERPTLITALQHNAQFATDEVINEHLTTLYRNYDYLTESDTANHYILQSIIDSWKNYADKLYATTLLEYDPLEDYSMWEDGVITDEKHKGTRESTGVDVTVTDTPRVGRVTEQSGYGFDSTAAGVPIGKTTENAPTGTDERRTQGSAANNTRTTEDISASIFDKDVRTFDEYHKHGSLAKSQELIEYERKIIVDVLEFYCSKFAEAFKLSNHIAFEPFESEV